MKSAIDQLIINSYIWRRRNTGACDRETRFPAREASRCLAGWRLHDIMNEKNEYARVICGKQITPICVICVNQWLVRVFSHRLTLISRISSISYPSIYRKPER
uniref:Uncharacterized protein n=1 Tax=Candidatus Methanogaster sp. ANME-2c ERB4 TaxID=2759911 RepID=A0A7G9YPS4_9EURY|nr:hypothetical protein CAGMOKBG_00028 [Methanosarcinales archaeon ANME-2c ERB4]